MPDAPDLEMLSDELPPTAAADVTVDITPEVTTEDFSFADFLEGVRPYRRSVKLHPHAHLIAEMDRLADEIESIPDGQQQARVDKLVDAFDALKAQYRDGVWYTVEGRSSEWVKKTRAEIAKQLGFTLDDQGDAVDGEGNPDEEITVKVLLAQIAAQTVTPSGVTASSLQKLLDTNEGELNKIVVAMTLVNNQLAQSAKVLDVDFSQRRSTNRATRRSSKR